MTGLFVRMSSRLAWLVAAIGVMLPATVAPAHEASMAVMVLREVAPNHYVGYWSLPPSDERFQPIFPEHCTWVQPELDCGQLGFTGKLSFEGLGSKQSAAMIRVLPQTGSPQAYTLTAAHPAVTVAREPGRDLAVWLDLADTYVNLGIDHILRGIDHLLFVLGLIWIVRGRWMLIHTITAFTIAHSLSLAAATFGWVGVPEKPLNAAIALSIIFVGVEIVRMRQGHMGLTARYPWVVAFLFGLLHGLGFATALTTLGIPQATLPFALAFFNIGVEIGQLAFVFLVLALMWAHRRAEATLPQWSAQIPAYLIGGLASFWFLERLQIMLSA